jgi:hypothetical protein
MGDRRRDGCGRNREIRERNGRPAVLQDPRGGAPRTPITLKGYQAEGHAASGDERREPWPKPRSGLKVSRASRTGPRRREMIPPGVGHKKMHPPNLLPGRNRFTAQRVQNGIYPPLGAGRKGLERGFFALPAVRSNGNRVAVTRGWETEEVGGVGCCRDRVRVGRFLATSIPGEAMGACPRSELLVVGVCARSNALRFRNADRQGVAA